MHFQNVLDEECVWGRLWHADISMERSVSARLWHFPWGRRLVGVGGLSVSQAEAPGSLTQRPGPQLWRSGW